MESKYLNRNKYLKQKKNLGVHIGVPRFVISIICQAGKVTKKGFHSSFQ